MEFRILGPLEVQGDEGPLPLGSAQQRELLSLLLLHRGEVVSTERLVDEFWGERAPPTAAKTVQVYVSRLRKQLAPGALETIGRGYRLTVPAGQLDLERFEALAEDGRRKLGDGDARGAAAAFAQALELWRGPPLVDCRYQPFAQSEIARLEELRLGVIEWQIDAELALGHHRELVAELERLVREHPLRERLRAQLMLALYRAGRQAQALTAYQDARRALADELGLEPGRPLRELEAAILSQDPAIDAPAEAGIGGRVARTVGLRPRAAIILGFGLLAAAVAAGTVELVGGGGHSSLASAPPKSLGLVDSKSGRIRSIVPVAGTPSRVAVNGRRVWVSDDDGRAVSLVPDRRGVSQVVQAGVFPSELAVGAGAVWTVDRERGQLVQINPDYGTVERSTTLRSAATLSAVDDRNGVDPWSIAIGTGAAWITDGTPLLRRVDPATGAVRVLNVRVPVNGVAVGEGGIWAISGPTAAVLRIDPRTGAVTARIAIVARAGSGSPYPIAVSVGLGSVWVLNANSASVTRIDPQQGGITAAITVGVARVPRRLAVGLGAAWVADADGTLARIDAATNALTTTALAPSLFDVAVGAGGVWVTTGSAIAGGSVAAGPPAGGQAQPLPPSRCSTISAAPGARPRYLIVSDLPLQGDQHDIGAQETAAISFTLRKHGFRAGRFEIGYQVCDDSTAAATVDFARCGANMQAYAKDPSVLGVVGPFTSVCAAAEIPIANRAPGGPLAMISPSTTHIGLTHRGPGANPGEPDVYYPTGKRNFARIVAGDDVQAAADVLLARQRGLHRVFVSDDGGPYGTTIAHIFALSARQLGLGLIGRGRWPNVPLGTVTTAGTKAIDAFARRVARSRPDGVFLGGALLGNPAAAPVVRELRAELPGVQLLAPDGFALFPDVVDLIGPSVEGLLVSQAGIAPSLLRGAGQRFVAQFGKQIGGAFYPYTAYAAQAAATLLDAIARSDGSRPSVTRALLATRVRDGIVGSFAITPTGDTTSGAVTIFRIEHGKPVALRVITPPAIPRR